MAVSCSKEVSKGEINTSEDQTKPTLKVETKTFTMVIDPETKLAIDDGSGKTSWEINDEIYIHGEYMNTEGYDLIVTLDGVTNTISPDKKTATIQIPVGDGTGGTIKEYVRSGWYTTLYAIYPASAAATRAIHTYYYSEVIPSNEPVMVGCNDNANTFHFKNICGIISFIIPDSEDFDTYVFTGNKNETIGYDSYGLRHAMRENGSFDDKYGGSYEGIVFTSGEQKSIIGAVSCDGATVHKICIPGGVNFTEGFTIKFIKDGEIVKKVSTRSSINLAVNDYLPLGDISAHLKTYTHSHVSALSSDNDLSVTLGGKANCYYVIADDPANAGATFKFPQYKGNSSTSTGVVYEVELLWETFNNSTAPNVNDVIDAVDYDASYIYFKLPNPVKPGNALIAAKNAIGEIIWSWHIWIPSSAITTSAYGMEDQVWMDRNLGAICVAEASGEEVVDVLSQGLLYSWGRKDPFPGPSTVGGSSPAATTGSFTMNGSQMSVSDSYKYPTTFVLTGADTVWPWTKDSVSGLWNGDSKTINDPCPPGYVVPKYTGKGVWALTTGFEADFTHKWFKMGVSPDYIVFPIVGYIDATTGSIANSGKRVYVWSSSNTESDGLSYARRVNDGSNKIEWERQARAGSIRCVAE